MTFAQFVGGGSSGIIGLFNTVVVPILFTLIFLVFVWGVIKYFFIRPTIYTAYSERDGYTEGRAFVLWGIIGIVVLFAVWGIVHILLSTLGFK